MKTHAAERAMYRPVSRGVTPPLFANLQMLLGLVTPPQDKNLGCYCCGVGITPLIRR